MNDYEKLVQEARDAINATETAYHNAQDEEDQTELSEALEILERVERRAKGKI